MHEMGSFNWGYSLADSWFISRRYMQNTSETEHVHSTAPPLPAFSPGLMAQVTGATHFPVSVGLAGRPSVLPVGLAPARSKPGPTEQVLSAPHLFGRAFFGPCLGTIQRSHGAKWSHKGPGGRCTGPQGQ